MSACLPRIFTLLLAASATAGCNPDRKSESAHPAARKGEWDLSKPAPTTTHAHDRPLGVRAKPTLVKRGRAPLVYLVESGDPIVIVVSDLTHDRRLASVPVDGKRTIIRVEAANGVFVGAQNVAPGPLASAHEYGIYVEVEQQSVIRKEISGPSEGTKP